MFKNIQNIQNKRIVKLLSGLLPLCILLSGCNIVHTIEPVMPSDTGSELSSSERADLTQVGNETQKQTEKPNGDTNDKNDSKDNTVDNNGGDHKDDSFNIGDGEALVIPAEAPRPASDPYANVNVTAFYSDYEPATGYWDAYYRTLHGLMSGNIAEQDQKPTLADDMPTVNGYYVRNTSALYSEDGNVYYVVDADGNIVNRVYKGAAYVTLEEVAAYVFAFGEVPANYVSDKKQIQRKANGGNIFALITVPLSVTRRDTRMSPSFPTSADAEEI